METITQEDLDDLDNAGKGELDPTIRNKAAADLGGLLLETELGISQNSVYDFEAFDEMLKSAADNGQRQATRLA